MNDLELHCGISIQSPEALREFVRCAPAGLDSLEVTGTLLDEPGAAALIRRLKIPELIIHDAMPSQLWQMVPEQSPQLGREFIGRFINVLESSAALGAAAASVTPDLARCNREPEYRRRLLELLRPSFRVFYERKLRLQLPLRLPSVLSGRPAGAGAAELDALMRDLMFSSEVLLELHPHEPAWEMLDPAELPEPFRRSIRTLRLVYEPGIGNRISLAQLRRAAALARPPRRRLTVLFAPVGGVAPELIAAEAEYCRKLAGALTVCRNETGEHSEKEGKQE